MSTTATPADRIAEDDAPGRSEAALGAIFVLLAGTGFAAKAIFAKLVYRYGVDATTLLVLRMLFALPMFAFMAWWSGRDDPVELTWREWGRVFVLGLLGGYAASYLDFLGLKYISAGLERLTLFLNPTFVLLISAIWLKRRIRRIDMFAFVFSYGGLALVFEHDLNHPGPAHHVGTGMALVLAGAVAYALYLVGGSKTVRLMGSMRFIAWAMMAATVPTVLQYFALEPVAVLFQQPPEVYRLMVMMAVFATVLPMWMLAEGLGRMGSTAASMVGMAGPVITIYLGHVFLDEPYGVMQIAGAALVLVGVAIMTLSKSES